MIRKGLILKIFDAAYMQRWNDKLRPMEFTELDKQAHKMMIAYYLGKFEEENNKEKEIVWEKIIQYCLFDLLNRIVATDIMPPLYKKVKEKLSNKYNEHIYDSLKVYLEPCNLTKEFENFLQEDDNIHKRIVTAAHHQASIWEFDILEHVNPKGFEIDVIRKELDERIRPFDDLYGMKAICEEAKREKNTNYKSFPNLCGELRFQTRWSHLHRIPKTSVMGHSFFVALLAYLLSKEIQDCCPKRLYNNTFTGLFHDLPELLTRDIIRPVKEGVGKEFKDLIKREEKELMDKKLLPLLPKNWHEEIVFFTQDEFSNKYSNEAMPNNEEIPESKNEDRFNPRDGVLLKALDNLTVFIEAKAAVQNGCSSPEFNNLIVSIMGERPENKAVGTTKEEIKPEQKDIICGINFAEIYADFS